MRIITQNTTSRIFSSRGKQKQFRTLAVTFLTFVALLNMLHSSNHQEDIIQRKLALPNFINEETMSETLKEYGLSSEDVEKSKEDTGCISRTHKLVYVHIPKTGGSTMINSEIFFDTDLLYLFKKRARPKSGHYPIWSLMSNAKERGIDNYVTATTIRHPCERFISAFRYVTSSKCNSNDMVWKEKSIGDRNIDEYVQHLEDTNWSHMMVHFRKQYPFLMNNELEFGVDHVLCQEQWNEGIERLGEAVVGGIRKRGMDRLFASHMLSNKHETCADLKPETRDAIERHYVMDYCLFDYPSLPTEDGNNMCVGTGKDKESFTARFETCKEKFLAQGINAIDEIGSVIKNE